MTEKLLHIGKKYDEKFFTKINLCKLFCKRNRKLMHSQGGTFEKNMLIQHIIRSYYLKVLFIISEN